MPLCNVCIGEREAGTTSSCMGSQKKKLATGVRSRYDAHL